MIRYDFVVIGSGPAGLRAVIQASKFDKKVCLIERQPHIGGVSVHTGTIPSKTLREAILYLTGWRQRGFYGRDYRLKKEITAVDLMQRMAITIRHEIEVITDHLSRNNITVFNGIASFVDNHTLMVEDNEGNTTNLAAEKILIATGTRPRRPDKVPFDDKHIIDSDGILKLQQLPKSIAVIGAGIIGLEYASMFTALDISVTLIHERDSILDFVDREIMSEFIHSQVDNGMVLRLGEKVESIEHTDNQVITRLKNGRLVASEIALFTAGRIGCTTSLKMENAGLEVNQRHCLQVDEHFRTKAKHIYAAGDVIGFPSLASTSMEQGRKVACHAFGQPCNNGTDFFPLGIYTIPEISMIGKTEEQLIAENIPYEVGTSRFRETARGQILGLREGILKLLVGLKDKRILGVHIVGEGATELIHIGQTVMAFNGILDYFVDNVFNYPTLAENYKIAALDAWNRMKI